MSRSLSQKRAMSLPPRGLSREQAAAYAGCGSLSTFSNWIRRGICRTQYPGPTNGTRKPSMQPLTACPDFSLQSRRPRSMSGKRSKMRVHLKGIHTTYKKLANGKTKKYYYAWKNGPRVDAEPGTPEFVRLYGEACKKKPAADTMRSLIDYFKDSDEYKVGSIH